MEKVILKLKLIEERLKNYNIKQRVTEILRLGEVQQAIINVIQERINERGIISTGYKLRTDRAKQQGRPAYASGHEKSNQSHVDLYNTGDFYEEWSLRVGVNVTKLSAPFITEVYKNFTTSFQSPSNMIDAIGTLTEQEIELISKRVIMPYVEADIKKLLNV